MSHNLWYNYRGQVNSVVESTTVIPAADLSVTKSDSPDPVPLGGSLTYTLTIANGGPSAATGVKLTDMLPEGVSFVSATPSQGSCDGTGTVICNLHILNVGDNSVVAVVVIPEAVGTIANSAQVVGNEADPSTEDNSITEATTVDPTADLSITKALTPRSALLGTHLTYTLVVANRGPSFATRVILNDELPNAVTLVSVTTTQGECSAGNSTIICRLGSLADGDRATVIIVVIADTSGSFTNTATVVSDVPDPDLADNTAVESATVTCPR